MKIKLLGTGAAEGIPAFCCECRVCKNALAAGGKEIRRRSGTLVDDDLMIEFSPDIYMHRLNCNIDFMKIHNIVLSHSHSDHFNPRDLTMLIAPVFAIREPFAMTIHGNESVLELYNSVKGKSFDEQLPFNLLQEGVFTTVGNKKILPLAANHDRSQKCYVFVITDGHKTFFYGHDSGYYPESTWERLTEFKLDLAVLDGVYGALSNQRNGHMGFITDIEVKKRMQTSGIADVNTRFVFTHFSHNGNSTHVELMTAGSKEGLEPAFDGMEIEI